MSTEPSGMERLRLSRLNFELARLNAALRELERRVKAVATSPIDPPGDLP